MSNDSNTDEKSAQRIIQEAKARMDDHLHSRRSVLAGGAALGVGAIGLSSTALADNHEMPDDGMPDGAMEEVTTDPSTDADVLNFALTLERLEARFYEEGLGYLSDSTIRNSETLDGFGDRVLDDVVAQLETTKVHEQVHEDVLIQVIELLGQEPAPEPEFDFGETTRDPDEFLQTAALLENTGVSAYNGAISLIQSPDLQTAGATIATVEGRHASYLNFLIGDDPAPDAFDEARSMSEVLDLAGPFFVGDTDDDDDMDEDDDHGDDDTDDDHGDDDERMYWQIDFGAGETPPDPPNYWPDDVMATLGNSVDGTTENPSHNRQQSASQLGDVTIEGNAFSFDDPDDPGEVSVSFTIDDDGPSRQLHLAMFRLPGPFAESEIEDQELVAIVNDEFAGGESGTLSLEIPE